MLEFIQNLIHLLTNASENLQNLEADTDYADVTIDDVSAYGNTLEVDSFTVEGVRISGVEDVEDDLAEAIRKIEGLEILFKNIDRIPAIIALLEKESLEAATEQVDGLDTSKSREQAVERLHRECPKCNETVDELDSLLREDGETPICSDCGQKEALESIGG